MKCPHCHQESQSYLGDFCMKCGCCIWSPAEKNVADDGLRYGLMLKQAERAAMIDDAGVGSRIRLVED